MREKADMANSVPKPTAIARKLRRAQTDAEATLWLRLRNRDLGGFKFRRQFPLPPYVADFCCAEARLVVELDGGQHGDMAQEDTKRTEFFSRRGYRVLRFWNDEALKNSDLVLEEILRHLNLPPA